MKCEEFRKMAEESGAIAGLRTQVEVTDEFYNHIEECDSCCDWLDEQTRNDPFWGPKLEALRKLR